MKTEIKTTTLLNYIETYNKYEYLIEKHIMKICPQYINNEDFVQDAKLGLLEYVEHNEVFNKLDVMYKRTKHAYDYMKRFIMRLYNQYSICDNIEILPLLTVYDIDDSSIDKCIDRCGIVESINLALNSIPERYSNILRMYYFDNLTLSQIAKLENVTSERIRQIIHKSLNHIRAKNYKKLKIYIED